MRIAVCIKQVPDVSMPMEIDAKSNTISQDGVVYIVNPYDKCAVEEAILLKEASGGEVTIITIGPPQASRALRSCMAMGADKGVHIWDPAFEESDPSAIAQILAKAIGDMEYDLVLCGNQALDDGSAQVPATLAELLGVPQVTAVTKLQVAPGGAKLMAERKLERGNRELLECSLPAVVSVEIGLNEPRYPTLPALMKALRQEVVQHNLSSLGVARDSVGARDSMTKLVSVSPPRPRPKKVFTPDSNLSPQERMKLIMSGGVSKKKSGDFLEGDPQQVAGEVLDFLKKEGIVTN